jgi:uncharacterized protein
MIEPVEMKLDLPVTLANGVRSTTKKVWNMLVASRKGDLEKVKMLASDCPELIYAQYNYAPPIHFAVREGHVELVRYLLENGAHDPTYKIYPFLDPLLTIAEDRDHEKIVSLLKDYNDDPTRRKYKGDNGEIHYDRTELQIEFQRTVDMGGVDRAGEILKEHPEFARDDTFFWSEGIMMMPAKEGNFDMIALLMKYGAKVPPILKWCQFYYFERYESAKFLMEKGMNPNTMSWQRVTILHDMAQKSNFPKAELLIKHGANLNAIDDEYQSTPLGMAARWGHLEMVKLLLKKGADPEKAGGKWATPLAWARRKGHQDIVELLSGKL